FPGLPPVIRASTPVLPTPVRGSSPSFRSRSATIPDVRTSSKPSSGCEWRSRRVATISSSAAALKCGVAGAAGAGVGRVPAGRVGGMRIILPRADRKRQGPGSFRPPGPTSGWSLLLQQLPPLDLLLQRVAVQHLELDAAVLRHVERRGVADE